MILNADEGTKLLNKAEKALFENDYITALERYKAAASLGKVEALDLILVHSGDRFSDNEGKKALNKLVEFAISGNLESIEIIYYHEGFDKLKSEELAKIFDVLFPMAEAGKLKKMDYIYSLIDSADDETAKGFFKRIILAENNNADMIALAAHMYIIGIGIEKNPNEAIKLYEKASELGSGIATYNLGRMYEKGEFFNKDCKKALELYNKAAEQGNSKAFHKIISSYKDGNSDLEVVANVDKMVEYIFKAADFGDLDFLHILTIYYNLGYGPYGLAVTQNKAMAVKCYEKLISCSEYYGKDYQLSFDMNQLGYLYCSGDGVEVNYQKAIELFEKAIELDNLNAMMNLANLYYEGLGVKQDKEKAFALLQLITEYEDYFVEMNCGEDQILPAMVLVARSYRKGDGIRQSGIEAFNWYKKAEAYSDHAFHTYVGENDELIGIIKNALGEMYENHEMYLSDQVDENIKDKDFKIAADYFEAAVELGNANAMANLAKKYRDGRGVVKDDEKAFELAQEAVEADEENVAALKTLAQMYDERIGTECNYEEMFKLYTKAAEKNDIEAIKILAHKADSRSEKIHWYEKLVELGDKGAVEIVENNKKTIDLVSRAESLEKDEKYVEAIEEYKKAAEMGSFYAMGSLALIYYNGKCGVEINYDEALKWFEMAAMNSSISAMHASDIYLDHKHDGINAIKMMKQMAKLDPNNISSVGDMYYYPKYYYQKVDSDTNNYIRSNTPIIEPNYVKAFQYYEEADKDGYPSGTHKLAKCYLKGEGVAQDREKAQEIFERNVKENDYSESIKELAKIYQLKAYELYHKEPLEYWKRNWKINKDDSVEARNSDLTVNGELIISACVAAMRIGDKDAIRDVGFLGEICYIGPNYLLCKIGKNETKGLELMIEAAKLGYTDPLCNVADSYNVEKNFDEAVKFNELAAKYGNVNSMRNLAELWHGVNNDEAIKWYTKAGDSGCDWCATTLAIMYLSGDIVDKDYRKAREYFEKALADEDIFNVVAAENLADMYFSNEYGCKNEDKALELYKKLAEYDGGDPEVMLKLARIYRGKNYSRNDAYEWFKKYAEHIKNIPEDVKSEIFEAYLLAAEYGNIEAMTDVADCYTNGFGTSQDLRQALYWHNKAANPQNVKRSINSVIALARIYRDGIGVEKDVIKAYSLFKSISSEKDSNVDEKELLDACISAVESGDKEALQDLVKLAITKMTSN